MTDTNKAKEFKALVTPFFVLAPMANITTYPFARQCYDFGADVLWTPMVHTDTILNNWVDAKKIYDFGNIKNYMIQIIGQDVQKVQASIELIQSNLDPIGFDLNFACPDKNIVKSGCGGAMLRKPEEIISIVEGARKKTNKLLSVKTRAGWDNHKDTLQLAPRLVSAGLDILVVHPRTVTEGFRGTANWEVIKKIKKTLHGGECLIVGSGDIRSHGEAWSRQKETGCDGIMVGRGALGRPWVFKEIIDNKEYIPRLNEIKLLAFHLAREANRIWGKRGITESRKHFSWYFRGFDGAKELRIELMKASTLEDVEKILLGPRG